MLELEKLVLINKPKEAFFIYDKETSLAYSYNKTPMLFTTKRNADISLHMMVNDENLDRYKIVQCDENHPFYKEGFVADGIFINKRIVLDKNSVNSDNYLDEIDPNKIKYNNSVIIKHGINLFGFEYEEEYGKFINYLVNKYNCNIHEITSLEDFILLENDNTKVIVVNAFFNGVNIELTSEKLRLFRRIASKGIFKDIVYIFVDKLNREQSNSNITSYANFRIVSSLLAFNSFRYNSGKYELIDSRPNKDNLYRKFDLEDLL